MLPHILSPSNPLLAGAHRGRRSPRPALGVFVLGVALGAGCSGADSSEPSAETTGGASTGGASTGGASTGGASTGGNNGGGGVAASGGVNTGGSGGGTSSPGAKRGSAGGSSLGFGGTSGTADATGPSTPAGSAGGSAGSSSGSAKMSAGCGKAPALLKSATVNQATPVNTLSAGGKTRQFLTRWPANYDNTKAYPLHIGLHGANGNLAENGRNNFGLWTLAKDSTIFVTLAAMGGMWSGASDLTYTDEVLKLVESELCIDTSRIVLEGFSQGAAMSWYLAGSRPGVFRAVVGHSGGGLGGAPAASPVAYLGSLGTEEGGGQNSQTDRFAKANGCDISTLPTAATGKHVCTPYKGCQENFPVTWCSYDGGHGFQDTDSGSSTTWVPQTVWDFLKPLLF